MTATCRIERVKRPTFDRSSGTASPGDRSTIYEGPCRTYEVSGGGVTMIGEDTVSMQNEVISIPWDVEVLPKEYDEVQILTHDTDPMMVGKRYVIDSSAKAGDMRPTRRFNVRGYQER